MFLYWIRDITHTDISQEGYVGISKDPEKRFKIHKKSKHKVGSAIRKYNIETFEIIFEGSEEECLLKEHKLRPSDNIGWNETTGGGKPPSTFSNTKGHKKSEAAKKSWTPERRAKQSEFMKNNKISPRTTSDQLKEKRSQNAKLRYSDPDEKRKLSELMTGKKRGKYNMTKEYPTIQCPHCNVSSNKHGSWSFMKRWHFDNCKSNPHRLVPPQTL